LARTATKWITDAATWESICAIIGAIPAHQATDHLEALDALTPGWTDHTPLGRRLHALNHTKPAPLAPPTPRLTADMSDQPDTLRDQDRGLWQATTASGTTHLLDLDRRRIQRRPSMGNDHNGNTPRTPVSRLAHDHEWLDLDYLIWCRTGAPLVALDHRPGPTGRGGYRVSTPVIAIQRLNEPRT
jgi:hypothetical protein